MVYQFERVKYTPKEASMNEEEISAGDKESMRKSYNGRRNYYRTHQSQMNIADFEDSILNLWDFNAFFGNLTMRMNLCNFLHKEEYAYLIKNDSYVQLFQKWVTQETNLAMERSDKYWQRKMRKEEESKHITEYVKGACFKPAEEYNPLDRETLYAKKKKQVLKAIVRKNCEFADFDNSNWELMDSLVKYMGTHKRKSNPANLEAVLVQAS